MRAAEVVLNKFFGGEMEALGKALFRMKHVKRESWDQLYLARRPIAEVMEASSKEKGNGLRGGSAPHLAGTYHWVWGFLPDADRAALFAAFNAQAVLWERRFEVSEAEWRSFA